MEVLAFLHWNVDPTIFTVGGFQLRYYGLLFAIGFVLGYYIMQKIFNKEGIQLKELDRMTTAIIIGTILGARIGHVVFYQPEFFLQNPLEIFMVWHGGLASHGGTLGVIAALYIFKRKSEIKSFLWLLDRVAIPTALVACLIRLGNLMNSEIYGHETSLPWGVVFEQAGEKVPKHPTQIYEALSYLAIFVFLIIYYRKNFPKFQEGKIFGYFMFLIFSVRFLIEFVKENQVDFEKSMPLNMGQLLSVPFIILGLYFLIRKPGTIQTSQ